MTLIGLWVTDGACNKASPELFFADLTPNVDDLLVEQAKSYCRKCPVAVQCLRYAMGHEDMVGIWSSTTTVERRKARLDLRKQSENGE